MAKKAGHYTVVGTRQPRLDGALKGSGRAEFTDDVRSAGNAPRKDRAQPDPVR